MNDKALEPRGQQHQRHNDVIHSTLTYLSL